MTKENGAATPKGDRPATVGTSAETSKLNGQKKQPITTLRTERLCRGANAPVVVVEEWPGDRTRVRIATLDTPYPGATPVIGGAPWGWPNRDKTIYHATKARSPAAGRYADELMMLIRVKAVDELERKHRVDAARRAEREGRL